MELSLNDVNRRCDAVAKKTTLKNYLKTNTYEHENCTLTSSATDSLTGTSSNDMFVALGGRLNDGDAIDGGEGNDTLNASVGASADAYMTSIEVLNITAINGNASIETTAAE